MSPQPSKAGGASEPRAVPTAKGGRLDTQGTWMEDEGCVGLLSILLFECL